MKLLILAEVYPSPEQAYAMGFVHSRSLEYVRLGHEPTVLSFGARTSYEFEGIQVRTEAEIRALTEGGDFDAVLSHAPNLRNHLRFLDELPPRPLLFFLHGHEVLLTRRHYPAPYPFDRNWRERIARLTRAAYDPIKLMSLHRFCRTRMEAGHPLGLVFVSKWMQREAIACNPWMAKAAAPPMRIIPNAINPVFLERHYSPPVDGQFVADFVCIRPFDNPKYAVDQVVQWARTCPDLSFHLYGNGRYFDVHPPPPNLTVIRRFVAQVEIPALLDRYRACAMPTRLDAQGVMACEMASYGMPLYTSELEVTREVFRDFLNVRFMPIDQDPGVALRSLPTPLKPDDPVRLRYHGPSLAANEMAFTAELVSSMARHA